MLAAKFWVEMKSPSKSGPDSPGAVRLRAVYSTDPDHPNKKWWDATPSGTIEMFINNPEAFEALELGQEYLVIFEKS